MATLRRSGLRASLLVAVAAAVVVAITPGASARPHSARPCAGAQALLERGLLDEAKIVYRRLALAKKAPPCAARGLRIIAAKLKRQAAAAPAKPGPCAGARALARQDLLDEAKDAYAKLAAGDDPPPCAARGLKRVKTRIEDERNLPERAGALADELFSWAGDLLKLALFVVVLLALVAALVLRFEPLAHHARHRAWMRSRPSLGDSKPKRARARIWNALMTPIAWAVATTVKIEDFKGSGDKEGPDMTRAITGLLPVVPARRSTRLEVALTPFAGKSALGEVTEAISGAPHGKAVAAVLSIARRLVPRKQLHVTGSVLSSDARGPGLALEIATDAGDVVEAETLWAKDFDPSLPPGAADDRKADRNLRLATAGAVWVLFAVLRYRRVLDQDDWRRFLGTPVWRSYVLVLIAVSEAHARDDLTTQAGYAHALEQDSANLPALFNLASVDVRRDEWEQAVRRLEDVRAQLDQREASAGLHMVDRDPLRYQVAYSLAYASLSQDPANHARITNVAKALRDDLVDLEETLGYLDDEGHRPTQDHDDLYMQLRRFEGPMLTLWAYLEAELDPGQKASKKAPALDRDSLIGRLRKGTLKHADLVRDLVAESTKAGPRTYYNLASYYTKVGAMDDARAALRDSVELGTAFADNAAADPELKPLRAADPKAFDKILKDYRAAPPTGLALIAAIGPKHAAALSELGVGSAEQLVARAQTAKQRTTLAHDLGVGPALVEHWARLADLRGLGIDVPRLNLLDAAGVGSRAMLAVVTTTELKALLESVKPRPAGVHLPTPQQRQAWIQRAKKDPGHVQG